MSYLQYAKDQNFDILRGGGKARPKGYFIEPTIIANVPEDSRVPKEETFRPVLCINTFIDEDDVLRRYNGSEFGLYASVYTRAISHALRVAEELEAGSVATSANSPLTASDPPMGGWKQSGDGREFSKHSREAWTEQKTVYIKL